MSSLMYAERLPSPLYGSQALLMLPINQLSWPIFHQGQYVMMRPPMKLFLQWLLQKVRMMSRCAKKVCMKSWKRLSELKFLIPAEPQREDVVRTMVLQTS
uniref:Uncharacterized protein n=1 Tax=Fagus sylvatica TaxID=28930 RepID=A0A2N9EPU3_FAGSY